MSPAPEDRARDEEIARLVRSGREEGIRRLMTEYVPRVKGALRKMTAFHPSHDALIHDATVDALLAVCSDIKRGVKVRKSLFGWLSCVARNNYVSKLREQRARPVLEIVGWHSLNDHAGGNRLPLSIQQARRIEWLWACIVKLRPLQHGIIVSDLDETAPTTDRELARKLDTSVDSVRVSRHKAHKRLRTMMMKRSSK